MNETTINGIDVSECEYINCCSKKAKCIILQDDICSDSQYCESEPNCYFKQLKRLQEENKRLQMLSCVNCGEKYLSPDGAELYEKNVQLQQENEELKKELEIKEKQSEHFMIGSGKFLDKLRQENEKLKKRCEEWALETVKMQGAIDGEDFKIDKYKQTLEEIREMVNEQKPILDNTVSQSEFTIEKLCDYDEKYIKIVRKINEVLNDRD